MIVLMMDFNENLLRDGPLQMALKQVGLIDPIRLLHKHKSKPPPTSKTGSCPIDAIFVSAPLVNITRGGYLKLGQGIGDHRPLFFDIPIQDILGESQFKIHRPEMRRLKCENPQVVQSFNKLLLQQLEAEGTILKVRLLKQGLRENTISTNECHIQLKKIDNSIHHATMYAEKRCRKLSVGQVPYSIDCRKATRLIELWNNVIRKKKGWNISTRLVKKLTKKCKLLIFPMQLSIEECEYERSLARKGYAQIKSNAVQNREVFLEGLAAAQAARGNEQVTNAIKRIKRLEESRATHRRIRAATKAYTGATERIQIPDPDDSTKLIITTDKEIIEKALKNENEQKILLAYCFGSKSTRGSFWYV